MNRDRTEEGTDESIIEGIVGEYVSELIDFSTWKMGQSSYDVSGLPAGLSAQVIGNNLIIKGTPTSILDNVVAKVTATDELGNVITRDIRFLIGSTERIVAHIPPITRLSENSTNIGEYVRAVGGSGEYSYEVSGDNSGKVSVDYGVIKCDGSIGRYTDEDGKAEYKYAVNPVGSFAYEILIRDKRISELSCTTKSTVTTIPTSTVIGYVYDASGQPIEGVYVNAFCTTNNKIGHNKSPFATDSTGKYTIKVAQNEMYTFFTKVGAKYRVNTTNAQMSCNINSAMYKVSVEMGLEGVDTICQYMSQTKEKKIESIIQYDSYEEQLYESINNVLYMLPGIYEMTATEVLAYKDGEEVGRYDIELDFVVTNMPLSVKAKLTKIKEYELISNQPLSLVLEPKEIAYIKIVPTKTATYTINSADRKSVV